MTILLIFTAGTWLNQSPTAVSFAEEPRDKGNEFSGPAQELLQAEVLDTVSLARAVHFVTPDVADTVASPGTYSVLSAGQHRLKLVALGGTHTVVVDALSTNHTEDIGTPIALYVQDDEQFPHVVLLLPGGTGLEAVGSYDMIRSRGMLTSQLRPIQILTALNKKVQKKGN